MISETKLDKRFFKSRFLLKGFSETYRLNRNFKAGGIMLFIREDIPSKFQSKQKSLSKPCM